MPYINLPNSDPIARIQHCKQCRPWLYTVDVMFCVNWSNLNWSQTTKAPFFAWQGFKMLYLLLFRSTMGDYEVFKTIQSIQDRTVWRQFLPVMQIHSVSRLKRPMDTTPQKGCRRKMRQKACITTSTPKSKNKITE